MRDSIFPVLLVGGLSLAVASCGSSNALTTGSVSGPSAASAAGAPQSATPSERALYVAATVSRAQRCGFHFFPDQIRTSYISAETSAGTPPEMIARITKEYDFTRSSVTGSIAREEGYCTEGRSREVKAALARLHAGDFNPPAAKPEPGLLGWLDNSGAPDRRTRLDGEKVFDDSAKRTRPRETTDY